MTDAFIRAISEYNRVRSAQVAALRNGEGVLFGEFVAAARKERDLARRALLNHQRKHCC